MVRHAMRLRTGSVLERSIRIWIRNFLPFTALVAIFHAPIIWARYVVPRETPLHLFYNAGFRVAYVICGALLTGAVSYGVLHQPQGSAAPMGRCFAAGLGSLRATAPISVVMGLKVGIPVALADIIAVALEQPYLFLLFLLVPAGFAARYWIAVCVAAMEGARVTESLRRAVSLTEGARRSILGLIVVIGAMGVIVLFVVGVAAYFQLGYGRIPFEYPHELEVQRIVLISAPCVGALTATLGAVAACVAYHDLRARKDAVDVHEVAAVFG